MMMGDEDQPTDINAGPGKTPSPFELFASAADDDDTPATNPLVGDVANSPVPNSSYGDVQDAIIASPSYSPPPDVSVSSPMDDDLDDDSIANSLPQSTTFWDDLDLPDEPTTTPNLQETQKSMDRTGQAGSKASAKPAGPTPDAKAGKQKEPSPFGIPGKPAHLPGKPAAHKSEAQKPSSVKKDLPSPFEEASKIAMPKEKVPEKQVTASTTRYFAPEEMGKTSKKPNAKEKQQQAGLIAREPDVVPFRTEDREMSGGSGQKDRGSKIVEIEAPALPLLPSSVQGATFSAVSAAQPYLSNQTVSLFFQMVGQIYVMTTPPGVSRTEIVLNNPAYAGSRFFGSTITIEKYASAPDSFNIRLTGNDAAVASFRENIPSLVAAFQNSNLPFRVHRIEAEYTIEKPIFRRKEQGEGKGEAGGGDLGERRK
jgi:hypothetical protein